MYKTLPSAMRQKMLTTHGAHTYGSHGQEVETSWTHELLWYKTEGSKGHSAARVGLCTRTQHKHSFSVAGTGMPSRRRWPWSWALANEQKLDLWGPRHFRTPQNRVSTGTEIWHRVEMHRTVSSGVQDAGWGEQRPFQTALVKEAPFPSQATLYANSSA